MGHRRDSLLVVVALCSLYWFTVSFFLAKRSLHHVSECNEGAALLQDVLGMTTDDIHQLHAYSLLSKEKDTVRHGCWMSRRVDSVIILLVDALRFDFCLYNLPNSVGSRLPRVGTHTNQTRLFRFVADPPTVTMQRLKALTTGGLPTFADISANFGGVSVSDDSWMFQLLKQNQAVSRGLEHATQAAFVGDDTWEGLFPNFFTESHPYPSFNTRDIDTVDDGCLTHLPDLTSRLQTKKQTNNSLEVVVVHFLGVDHVGHTYGPHNKHMDAKLRQMDDALSKVLDAIDRSPACHAALIFGDHGMTEDGNHGGGTEEEVSAALFVHTSPACGSMADAVALEHDSSLIWANAKSFASIHQIDLVPTLSILLGLPVPFANLGSLVPSLIPGHSASETATALALNAAQVWRYLSVYSVTANKLPDLPKLKVRLDTATSTFQRAVRGMQDEYVDYDRFNQASALYKLFLTEALRLGQRVWTRFDHVGMITGIVTLGLALIAYTVPLFTGVGTFLRTSRAHLEELTLTTVIVFFLCGLLTFSNSYIYEEQGVIMYFLTILSLAVAWRLRNDSVSTTLWRGVLLIPVASRLGELFVSGHGMDPSIRVHVSHSAIIFLMCLFILVSFRWCLYKSQATQSRLHALSDCIALALTAISWWEKRNLDQNRNGFLSCRIALGFLLGGLFYSILQTVFETNAKSAEKAGRLSHSGLLTTLCKVLLSVLIVTGPSTAATLVLYTFQTCAIYFLVTSSRTSSLVVAALWKLVTRHVFFATNHGCGFNRLQYSAAFVATTEFNFIVGGLSLFLNTFGWEMAGLGFAWLFSRCPGRSNVWRIYTSFQLLEAFASCISVTVLKRHLMVWDIYAPHFIFVAIFTALNGSWQIATIGVNEFRRSSKPNL
jgi:phosphatidylinositol glycan class O